MKILFPNEHGAWGMFVASFLVGWLAAPELSWRPLLLLPAAVGAFLARYPAGIYFKKRRVARAMKITLHREKKWFLIYSVLTAAAVLPLFYPLGWRWLLPFAGFSIAALVFHLRAVIRRKERTFFVEWSAMAGISVLAPAASYAAVLRLHALSLLTWFLVVLFNTWRIIIVRRRVARKREEPVDFRSVGRREILYSLIFIALIAGIVRIVVSIPHGGFDR